MIAIIDCLDKIESKLKEAQEKSRIYKYKIYLRLNFSIDVYIVSDSKFDLVNEFKEEDKNLIEGNDINIRYYSKHDLENDGFIEDLFASEKSVIYGSRFNLDSFLSQENTLVKNDIPIITFYSYKGGMGRTTTMFAYALDLAKMGKKVFVIDCDLEAPGYLNFFDLSNHSALKDGKVNGLVEFFCDLRFAKDANNINVENYIINTRIRNDSEWLKKEETSYIDNIYIMPAGNLNEGIDDADKNRTAYLEGLSRINISDEFSTKDSFEKLFEQLNAEDGIKPDVILIDSRTGFNDIIGTAIQYFSDVVVGFFGSNEQSVPGLLQLLDIYTNNNKNFELILVNSILPNDKQGEYIYNSFTKRVTDYLKDIYDEGNLKNMPYIYPMHRIEGYDRIGVKDLEPEYIRDIRESKKEDYNNLFDGINAQIRKRFPSHLIENADIQECDNSLDSKIEDFDHQCNEKKERKNIDISKIDTWTLRNKILQNLKVALADSQNMYAENLEINEKYFFYRDCMYELFDKKKFLIRGYKGTGKTYLYKALSSDNKIAQNIRKKANEQSNKVIINDNVKIHYIDIISIGHGEKSFDFEETFYDAYLDKIKENNVSGFYGKIWQIHTWISILLDPLFEDIKQNSKYSDKITNMSGPQGIKNFVEMIQVGLPVFVEIENDMEKINKRLVNENMQLYILYDQLDTKIKPNHWGVAVSPLIDYWRERWRKYSNIYPKIFVRTDLFNRKILGTNNILLQDNIINIEWSIEEIFSYFFKLVWSRDKDIFFEIMKRPGRDSKYTPGRYTKFLSYSQISEDNQIIYLDKSAIIPYVNVFFGKTVYSSETKRDLGSPYEYFQTNLANADNKSISLRPFITIFTFNDDGKSKNAIEKALAEHIPNRHVTSIMSSNVYATRDIRIATANKYFDDLASDEFSKDLLSVRDFINSAAGEKYRLKSLSEKEYLEMLKNIIATHKMEVVSNEEDLSALLKANGIINEKPKDGQMWWDWALMYSYAWGLKNYEKQQNPKRTNALSSMTYEKFRKPKRLSALVAIYNVAASTIVEYLASKGIEIENNPNAKIQPEWLTLLDEKFKTPEK